MHLIGTVGLPGNHLATERAIGSTSRFVVLLASCFQRDQTLRDERTSEIRRICLCSGETRKTGEGMPVLKCSKLFRRRFSMTTQMIQEGEADGMLRLRKSIGEYCASLRRNVR